MPKLKESKFKLNLKRKLPKRCPSKCPFCGMQCLGAMAHIGTVEHQCNEHFWIVGSLKALFVRNVYRAILELAHQVDDITKNDQLVAEKTGFESGYEAGFKDGRRVR